MNSKSEDSLDRALPNPMVLAKDGGTPWSERFEDTYFDRDNGLDESRHVFLGGCALPGQWANQDRFVIGELGFGTGLNFLAAWKLWRQSAPRHSVLHYLSIDQFPLTAHEIAACFEQWPELAQLKSGLIESYPNLQPGTHRVFLDKDRVVLTLIFDHVEKALKGIDAKVDAWFMDGFAPSKNPDMWRPEIVRELARLSKPAAWVATFTVAGHVRRDLKAAGFDVEKRAGIGKKREVLAGRFNGVYSQESVEPWFATPPGFEGPSPRVAIVGGGLAGAHAAHAFARRNCTVTVFDRNSKLADEASSVPAAVFMPRLTAGDSVDGSYFATAWRFGLQLLQELEERHSTKLLHACGVLQMAHSEREAERLEKIWQSKALPSQAMQFLSALETSDVAKLSLDNSGLFFPGGGLIQTETLCRYLADDATQRMNCSVAKCRYEDGVWALYSNDGVSLGVADIVVIANGLNARHMDQTNHLPLTARLGQLSYVESSEKTRLLACVLAGDGHVTPPIGNHHIIGATFDHIEDEHLDNPNHAPSRDADLRNLGAARQLLPKAFDNSDAAPNQSWMGLRCTTPDHLPIAGPVPDHDAYVSDFSDIRHGRHWVKYPDAQYHPGLYALTGLGARGLVTAPLAAELIASQAMGEPLPIPRAMANALHPGRFTVRSLKRAKD